MIEDDRQLLADVLARRLRELLGARSVQKERDRVAAQLPLGRAGVLQVAAGDDGRLLHEVPDRLSLAGRDGTLDELEVRRNLTGGGREQRSPVGGGSRDDQLQLQEGGALDQVLDPLGVVDSRKLHENAVFPLPGNERLRDAELVDAVANRLHRLRDGVLLDLSQREVLDREDPLPPRGRDRPVGQESLDGLVELSLVGRGRDRDRKGPVIGKFDRTEGEALLARLALQLLGRVVPLRFHGVDGVHLEDEVDPPAQVEAELDAFLEGVIESGLAGTDPLPPRVGVTHGHVTRDHSGHDQNDEQQPPANPFGQGFLLKKEPWSLPEPALGCQPSALNRRAPEVRPLPARSPARRRRSEGP